MQVELVVQLGELVKTIHLADSLDVLLIHHQCTLFRPLQLRQLLLGHPEVTPAQGLAGEGKLGSVFILYDVHKQSILS